MNGRALPHGQRPGLLRGLLCAAFTVLVAAAWPVVTRLGVTQQSFAPLELASLRYGVAGLVLLPVLLRLRPRLDARLWREGVVLALCQGAPLAVVLGTGLQHAPASHGSALTLGLMPAITVLLQAGLGVRSPLRAALGAALVGAGAVGLAGPDLAGGGPALLGYGLFIVAAVMGSLYFVRLRRSGLTPLEGAAFVAALSGAGAVLALAVLGGLPRLAALPAGELGFQLVFQGLIVGALSLVTLNRAIADLGPAPATLCLSLVPIVAAVLAIPVLGEWPTVAEAAAIAVMVLGAALPSLAQGLGGGVRNAAARLPAWVSTLLASFFWKWAKPVRGMRGRLPFPRTERAA